MLTFDTTVKAMQQIDVQTWLDKPDNAVTLKSHDERTP